MAENSIWLWVGFNAFVMVMLALDLGVFHRKQKAISVKDALWTSFAYFLLALAFNAGVFYFRGEQAGMEFLSGYLIEKSLSLDNIFVFVLIFTHFAVPQQYQHRVLFWGIIGALVMRASLIFLGAALIEKFHWVIYVFGAFLVITGIKMLMTINQKPDLSNNHVISWARRRFKVTEDYHGQAFFVRKDGIRWMTPLFLVLILIELTDLVFALDSIPAIFAITKDPFIVYTSNVFAILGLRALYFALAGIIHRFHYLKYGLSLVLVVVGIKMLLNAWFGGHFIPTWVALVITAVLIFGSMLVSILKTRNAPPGTAQRQELATGWVPGSGAQSKKKRSP